VTTEIRDIRRVVPDVADGPPPRVVAVTRELRVGQILFAASLAGLGLLSLLSGDFASSWQPVPAAVPWRAEMARVSGLVLLASGIGALWRRSAAVSALVLTVNVTVWLFVLHLPRVVMRPAVASLWLGFAETLAMVAGGLIVTASAPTSEFGRRFGLPAGDGIVRLARFWFAVALPVIGLSHFVYLKETTALVPAWLPNRSAIAYLTGAAHMSAGAGLLVRVIPRVAVLLEAAMISSFTLLVWVPRVGADPTSRTQWTALFASSVLTGAAWAVAGSFESHTVAEPQSVAAGAQ
jgi:uncharacterized membrane protein